MPALTMQPATGERLVRFVGDRLRFSLRFADNRPWPEGWQARLRTNLGRASAARSEIIASVESDRPPTLASWRDIPFRHDGHDHLLELPLTEVGWFRAKAYALDERGWQHWPEGPDFGVSVQPNWCRTANTIYCAWPRLFGATKPAASTIDAALDAQLRPLDNRGFAAIPPSGKLRDLIRELPHIFGTLGCRILHLLPVNPTPTTYARFGRFGSPYACEDLLGIDPALVEFDHRTTGVEQFRELADAVHAHDGRLFLDIVINHTGWGSTLQENQPGWFVRKPDGTFVSPGAWGTTWEDLVELDHQHAGLRRELAAMLLEWCRRGVDGFRCDAGYKVPLPVWEFVTARVRQEFPDTVFLLEGLGGGWGDTETLLTAGGMQWAYSELFQNHDGLQVQGYLDHALHQSERAGLLINYSETHDNLRLAAQGRAWSLLRNRLCALTSVSGGFGFTCGVEWLAPEKINVHSCTGLNWGHPENLVSELARLNQLLADHPCFFDGAKLTRLSPSGAPVYALRRESAHGQICVLVLANTDAKAEHSITVPTDASRPGGDGLATPADPGLVDLLGQAVPGFRLAKGGLQFTLGPAAVFCLTPQAQAGEAQGTNYRRRKAAEALALTVLAHHLPIEQMGNLDAARLVSMVETDLARFLSAASYLAPHASDLDVLTALEAAAGRFPRVVTWRSADRRRVTPVPTQHWLLIEDATPFRAALQSADGVIHRAESILANGRHVACLPPVRAGGDAALTLTRCTDSEQRLTARLSYLSPASSANPELRPGSSDVVLLANGIGGMARMAVDLGKIQSKYDCLLAANLHSRVPVDRHVFVKRARVWINADGFISPLDGDNLIGFEPGPPARWRFLAHAGDGRTVEVHLQAGMAAGGNTTLLHFTRLESAPSSGTALPPEADVRLTVRLDIEDRNFHSETRRNGGAEHHFATHTHPLPGGHGFTFAPAADRHLQVRVDKGRYHPQPEWCEHIPHAVEVSRGQVPDGDAYSPGWFEIPLPKGSQATLRLTAGSQDTPPQNAPEPVDPAAAPGDLGESLERAARAFLVRRDEAVTVIAGYPWFLDWGRDTLICARGLISAGMHAQVRQLLQVFGRFEKNGTLPNTIHGDDASNRDTSDAPLWYGVVCEELNASDATNVYRLKVDAAGRSVADVLRDLAAGYLRGTPNGIRVDSESALVWSPPHFTWMDTNYPAGTPREGYPIEIQALWIRLLRQLDRLALPPVTETWATLADRAQAAFDRWFWLEREGWHADVLLAGPNQPAAQATADNALRSNCLLPVALGLVGGQRAQRTVAAARQHLVIPGALRSLAPLPVNPPLPIRKPDGGLLNDPAHPYWGHYEGDEDMRRKPAYHNGTAWVWTLPTFCEALARAWDLSPAAITAARDYLAGVSGLLDTGCRGQLPEILDGDAPHAQRGCDAQAWSATEALRVWRWLDSATKS